MIAQPPKTLREQEFTEVQADTIVRRFIIAQLEADRWSGGLDLSAQAQGALVRASNRLARKLRKELAKLEREEVENG